MDAAIRWSLDDRLARDSQDEWILMTTAHELKKRKEAGVLEDGPWLWSRRLDRNATSGGRRSRRVARPRFEFSPPGIGLGGSCALALVYRAEEDEDDDVLEILSARDSAENAVEASDLVVLRASRDGVSRVAWGLDRSTRELTALAWCPRQIVSNDPSVCGVLALGSADGSVSFLRVSSELRRDLPVCVGRLELSLAKEGYPTCLSWFTRHSRTSGTAKASKIVELGYLAVGTSQGQLIVCRVVCSKRGAPTLVVASRWAGAELGDPAGGAITSIVPDVHPSSLAAVLKGQAMIVVSFDDAKRTVIEALRKREGAASRYSGAAWLVSSNWPSSPSTLVVGMRSAQSSALGASLLCLQAFNDHSASWSVMDHPFSTGTWAITGSPNNRAIGCVFSHELNKEVEPITEIFFPKTSGEGNLFYQKRQKILDQSRGYRLVGDERSGAVEGSPSPQANVALDLAMDVSFLAFCPSCDTAQRLSQPSQKDLREETSWVKPPICEHCLVPLGQLLHHPVTSARVL